MGEILALIAFNVLMLLLAVILFYALFKEKIDDYLFNDDITEDGGIMDIKPWERKPKSASKR